MCLSWRSQAEKLAQAGEGDRRASSGGAGVGACGAGAGEGGLSADAVSYRNMLRCKVCETRQKEAVITKCYHMFCHPCIKANLETRHRKCPACGAAFGQGDVKTVYF